jgi:hypothetical protein
MGERLAVAVLLALAAGCQDDIVTEFPDGLEPLEDNAVPPITAVAPVEQLATRRGEDGYKWVHGRGVVLAPPATVWALAKDADLMASVCDTDRHTIALGPEPQYEYGFEIHYEVDQIVTVAWDEVWRYGTVDGTPAAPSLAIVRYQKVFGSDFITTLEGSIELLARPDAGQTELQFIEHLDAFGGSADQMEASMKRRFALLAAAAHGTAPPGC